jgi:hypothetical protein
MFYTVFKENQNTKSFPENHAVCYTIWKNTVQPDRLQMTIQEVQKRCNVHAG